MKHENFKTCEQSGFCKRNRVYADEATSAGQTWVSPYRIDSKSLKINRGQITGTILKAIDDAKQEVRLPLVISFLKSGSVRVTVDEERRQKGEIELRHGSQARKERYNEASKWALIGGLTEDSDISVITEKDITTVLFGPIHSYKAIIKHAPFAMDFERDENIHIRLNSAGFMNMEHWRPKVEKEVKETPEGEEAPPPEVSVVDESTWWEETFGGNTDSKPKGPESIGLDITFQGYEYVFGIPEHAGPLSLKETRYVGY